MKINFSALKHIHLHSLKHLSNSIESLVEGRLWLKVIIGMIVGIIFGILVGPSLGLVSPSVSSNIGNWVALPGQIFLSLIQMIVIPLIFASIIRGLCASEDIQQLKQLGLYSVIFFLVTTVAAIVLGISLAYLIEPGRFIDAEQIKQTLSAAQPIASDLMSSEQQHKASVTTKIVELIPKNPLGSMLNLEMLQIVIFAVIVGVALLTLDTKHSKPLLELLGSLQEVCMKIVSWAMALAPYAVFGLMAQLITKIGFKALLGMSVYVVTVLMGLLCMLIIYVLILLFFGKKNLVYFFQSVREAQLLAFSTSSSAAVMPLSIKVSEEKLKVRSSISQFVIPLGATINMNGTALYQGVATIFLAQIFGIDLSFGSLVLVVVTAVAASIGSPATPGVGIVILAMVLTSAGIPTAGIALILGVDRILDMSRTAINVTGDLVATVVIDRLVGKNPNLKKI